MSGVPMNIGADLERNTRSVTEPRGNVETQYLASLFCELDMNIFKKKNEESVDLDWFKVIPISIAGFYGMGFLIWNIYLALFGFFEYNFLQTRFLSAGIVASILIFPAVVALYSLTDFCLEMLIKFFKKVRFLTLIKKNIQIFLVSSVFVIGVVAYAYFIFPNIPQFLGGARPVVASMLGTPEQILYLKNFNISSAPNAGVLSVQTVPICILYQNNEYFLLGVQYVTGEKEIKSIYLRNLLIKTSQVLGFQYGLGQNIKCKASDFFIGLNPLKGEQIYDINVAEPIICK